MSDMYNKCSLNPQKDMFLHIDSCYYLPESTPALYAGTIALSGQLADSLEALYNARIPRDWLAKSWEASTLGNWFSGLLARHDQLAKWLTSGRPKAYWLTGFFNPQVCKPFPSPTLTFKRIKSMYFAHF